jgi:hypothetical protein
MTNPSCIPWNHSVHQRYHVGDHGQDRTWWNPTHPLGAANSNWCHRLTHHPSCQRQQHSPVLATRHVSLPKCLHKDLKESKCICDRTHNTEHWTILQRTTHHTHGQYILARPRPFQQTGLNHVTSPIKQEIGLPPSDYQHYYHLQGQDPWTHHQLWKPHALFAAFTSMHDKPAQLFPWGNDMISSTTPFCNFKARKSNNTNASITHYKTASSEIGWLLGPQSHCHNNGQKLPLTKALLLEVLKNRCINHITLPAPPRTYMLWASTCGSSIDTNRGIAVTTETATMSQYWIIFRRF